MRERSDRIALTGSLVELIVLNVGLSAGIIDQKLFSMFVVEAVTLTFLTTPVTLWIYPDWARQRLSDLSRKASMIIKGNESIVTTMPGMAGGREHTTRFLVVLQKLEHLSALMFLTQLLEPVDKPRVSGKPAAARHNPKPMVEGDVTDDTASSSPSQQYEPLPRISGDFSDLHVNALKLIELTGRTFSVMQSAEKDQILLTDDALQLYKQFGRLRGVEVTPHISVVEAESFPTSVASHAEELLCQLVIIPWTIPEGETEIGGFDTVFDGEITSSSPMYSHFLRRVFGESHTDMALFIDRGFGSGTTLAPGGGQHIFLPFFGGPDDRLALRFVVQLCAHSNVTATVLRIEQADAQSKGSEGDTVTSEDLSAHDHALRSNQLTAGRTQSVGR